MVDCRTRTPSTSRRPAGGIPRTRCRPTSRAPSPGPAATATARACTSRCSRRAAAAGCSGSPSPGGGERSASAASRWSRSTRPAPRPSPTASSPAPAATPWPSGGQPAPPPSPPPPSGSGTRCGAAGPSAVSAVRGSRARPVVNLAFEFLVLTASRSGEVRGARWSALDAAAGVWTIPATRMKAKRGHRARGHKKSPLPPGASGERGQGRVTNADADAERYRRR